MKYPTYPQYKDSGVAWLGKVPEDWNISPLKHSAMIKTGYAFNSDDFIDEGIPVLRIGEITKEGNIDFSNAKCLPVEYGILYRKVLVQKDDIVMAMTGATIGKAGRYSFETPGLLNQRVCLFRPVANSDQNYLWYTLNTRFYAEYIALTAFGGAQPNISDSSLLACVVPMPPSSEQTAIAVYLDRETGRIDTLVAKKRKLVELLKEKRIALISRAVIRGLPADVEREFGLEPHKNFKQSGVEWLGELPEKWLVKKGRYVGRLLGSVSPSETEFIENEAATEEGLPYAKVDDLNQIDGTLVLTFTKAKVIGYKAQKGKYLVFPKRGAAIFTNKVAVVEQPMLFDTNLMGWQIYPSFNLKFIAFCLISRRLDDLADVSTVPQINNKHINPAEFPCPPLDEQTAIAIYLDRETSKIDRLIKKVEAAIARLQEYRTALITAAVTGKIDVREAA